MKKGLIEIQIITKVKTETKGKHLTIRKWETIFGE